MSLWFWVKAVGAFLLAAVIGLGWAYLKNDLGKDGEKVDYYLKWFFLLRYVLAAVAALAFAFYVTRAGMNLFKPH